jgi:hypothetical protein
MQQSSLLQAVSNRVVGCEKRGRLRGLRLDIKYAGAATLGAPCIPCHQVLSSLYELLDHNLASFR